MKLEDINDALLVWGYISGSSLSRIKQQGLVIVPEGRPYLTGLRHNVILLKKENIDFVYCTDNMLGLLFYKNKIKKTLLFYRKLNKNGVTGICGSLYVCLLSKLHNVPINITPQDNLEFSFPDRDCSTLSGNDFVPNLRAGIQDFIVKPEDEFIDQEVLR